MRLAVVMWADSAALGGRGEGGRLERVPQGQSCLSAPLERAQKEDGSSNTCFLMIVCGIYEIDLQTGNVTEALRLQVFVCKP